MWRCCTWVNFKNSIESRQDVETGSLIAKETSVVERALEVKDVVEAKGVEVKE
jgi:hypothetical protein